MKSLAKKALMNAGVLRVAATLREAGAAILMYHSVMENPASQDDLLGGIGHSRDVFRRQMEMLAREYRPMTLDELAEAVRRGQNLAPRAVVVTFDDGYADNYEVAAPVLNQVGISATFYVTVECVADATLPWPARLRFAFRSTQKRSWTDSSGICHPLQDSAQRESAYLLSCDECCKLTGETQKAYITAIEREFECHVPKETGALMMNFEQVRGLTRQGHTVGSHTTTHPNLAHVTAAEAHVELAESKCALERELNAPIHHFSYPCPALPPNWNAKTIAQSREAGYETAVTTEHGVVHKGDDPLCWKRIPPTKTVDGLKWNLESAFAGRRV